MADKTNKKDDLIARINRDLKYSSERYSNLYKKIKEDFEFSQGLQWADSDVISLRNQGVKALTINKIKPIIKLVTGIERQSRSDIKAFPEGGEDVITAEMVNRLVKNIAKIGRLQPKQSEQFKNGSIGGLSYIEPYLDFSYDLINPTMRFKPLAAVEVYPDPDGRELDYSDHRFNIRVRRGLLKSDLETLFPDQQAKIDKLQGGSVMLDNLVSKTIIETDTYPALTENNTLTPEFDIDEPTYDLIVYEYKIIKPVHYVVIQSQGVIKEYNSKEEAEQVASQIPEAQVVVKKVPETYQATVCGDQVFENDRAWFYPRWKGYGVIPYIAETITENLGKKELEIQGIVRGIKDLQDEFNKRRTQELRHLNASTNSGFDIEEGQLTPDEEARLKKYGSSPGFVSKRKKGSPPLNRFTPMPLSQGHAQLAAENMQDLKEASGVNPDLLANDSQSQSGRAILFKQRQGMVMIQEMLDNFSQSKETCGRFIISQLKEIYTVETALRTLGDAWITDNFTVPVNSVLQRGLDKVAKEEGNVTDLEKSIMLQYPSTDPKQAIVDENNNLVTTVDIDTAIQTVNQVLNDSELNKFDVSVGEGPFAETIRMSNFMEIKELAQQGVPIPPQTLIELSMIPDSEKKKIIMQLQQMQLAAQSQPAKTSE